MGRVTTRTPARRLQLDDDGLEVVEVVGRPDTVTVEEPLQVRVGGRPLTVTMRTPGDDFDLTIGFLLTEGLIGNAQDVATLMHCQDEGDDGRPTFNVVDVVLQPGVELPDVSLERSFFSTSSCGVCGKASVDAVRVRSPYDVAADTTSVSPAVLAAMPDALRTAQKVFDRTGGLHAAGLFTADGQLLAVREDIGRHNAVDKVIGWAAREGRLPLTGCVLFVSSRASFELTQKAMMAGIPCLAAVSAPSSLAIELARESGMTLAGFVRPPRMTVYAGGERLGLD
ncbi:formate dehydrogenase accessory sulfurtransferase FdhD [Angustibacter sp. Root456]|uniref:formate dehydrogenase accessory sulfurtransferase FdhD n=1 Tax=Angustibacter sp. Root456 TaxID=1736539 RepID=UPI0006FEDF83|nr:formate dehydrogenase accessory sulfurtransferase FdhD [Angustibacter sp. Root456]KQX67206.1 formate dehydrogenase family accessory protein FdhD [Angustibacter sp. Root456]